MTGIHDVCPPVEDKMYDPVSYKKLKKGEGVWMLEKDILGLDFNGEAFQHTVQVAADKRDALLLIITQWLRAMRDCQHGIPFEEFRSVICKLHHAFGILPAAKGILSLFNKVISKKKNPPPKFSYLHQSTLY
mmetsp:Transcript_5994/g.13147  ORF Transcript_5994/g.13147 Transcript_5994/m.13147 type:complete len:132 (-) Transcript_5994:1328-1723(-)